MREKINAKLAKMSETDRQSDEQGYIQGMQKREIKEFIVRRNKVGRESLMF